MILDELLETADATALSTSGTGRQLVGDVIDLSTVAIDHLAGGLFLVVQVETAFTSGGSATVSFEIVSDAQAALATDGSASVHFKSLAFPVAQLTAGRIVAAVELAIANPERFLGVIANVGTAALTAGKINAFLTSDVSRWQAWADAI